MNYTDEMQNNFSTQYMKLKKESGLTAEEIADRIGADVNTVKAYTRKKKPGMPSVPALFALADLFKVDPEYLLDPEAPRRKVEAAAAAALSMDPEAISNLNALPQVLKDLLCMLLKRPDSVRAVLEYLNVANFRAVVSVPQAEKEYKSAEAAAAAADRSAPITVANNAMKKKSNYMTVVNVLRMNKHDAVHEFENLINDVIPAPDPEKM